LQVRYLGCPLIIARSFARIHETNLKKQGVLPLIFTNEDDYTLFNGGDLVDTVGVVGIEPDKDVIVKLTKADGSVKEIKTYHTMSKDQIEWFMSGSALNRIAARKQ